MFASVPRSKSRRVWSRNQMVLDTVSAMVETTVESQLSVTVSEGDL